MALIRRARPEDAAGIAEVHVASWRTTYPGMVPDGYLLGLSVPGFTQRWRRILADQSRIHGSFVAVEPPLGVVGFASCGTQRTAIEGYGGEFYALYLYDHAQGRGIGRHLMAAMANELTNYGMNSAVVWVLANNPSRWFYERLGGCRLAEKIIGFAGTNLTEAAYGWRDLAPLARLSADPPVR
ncbi:GNAT family N-acetyltransferase [Skermanella mucosa]|uniref:GNAT family N-acetyltransferase n=1 Tax=Skermanella mucosa TaxID=1789672 RepID=UPI00192C6E14|nr:GNAT family N-acetyltransferase [Skermanella mucosa]UEM23636.1 GNAT family N-acetyltransferase [Skermanella mucosa]